MRWILAFFYSGAGIAHLAVPEKLLLITPAWVPFAPQLILLTGIFEIAASIALLARTPLRWWAGAAMALYALCVWPANFKHAIDGIQMPYIGNSLWYHVPRLAFQPVIIWWALYCSGVIEWPWRAKIRPTYSERATSFQPRAWPRDVVPPTSVTVLPARLCGKVPACYFAPPHRIGRADVTDVAADELRTIYPTPHPRVIAKARPTLDMHSSKFISLSPFCVLASSGPDGTVDASPRGGGVGFVRVASPTELQMPDRPGNNRIDTFQNLMAGSGHVQLIFFVPGIDDTLRVSGVAKLVKDAELMASMEEFGKLPRAVLSITVTESYFHCGKALMRSKLWSPEVQVKRSVMPSISEMVHDQTKLGEPMTQEQIDVAYRQQL